jgi:formate/nitrite transporter
LDHDEEVNTGNVNNTSSDSDQSDAYSPNETAKKIENSGVQKTNLNFTSSFILSILAGAFISLGGIYFTFATSQIIITKPFTQILGGLVFSLGLILVVIAGAELFTGNNLSIMSLLSKKITTKKMLKNWIIVYIGNFVGSISTAAILYMSKAWTANNYDFGIRAIVIASHKVNLGFVDAFFLGILCNSLVCLALWLAASGKTISGKILGIIFPISAFVALGFEHSVANMYFLTFALMIKDNPLLLSAIQTAGITVNTSNIDFTGFMNNIVPVTLGNIVGGSVFVGIVYWLAYLRSRKEN